MSTDRAQMKQATVARQTENAASPALLLDDDTRALPGCADLDRRTAFRLFFGSWLALGSVGLGVPDPAHAAALTKEQRDQLTADQIIDLLKAGNERFRTGKMQAHDYLAQKRASAGGQYPAAAILSCIDSRAPAEIILDTGIGDTFNARVAGNIANDDIIGSLEFACAAAGALARRLMALDSF